VQLGGPYLFFSPCRSASTADTSPDDLSAMPGNDGEEFPRIVYQCQGCVPYPSAPPPRLKRTKFQGTTVHWPYIQRSTRVDMPRQTHLHAEKEITDLYNLTNRFVVEHPPRIATNTVLI
jgi:hypothetical protein